MWVKYFSILMGSTLKFIIGPLTGYALGLTWWETAIFSFLGMLTGVLGTLFIGKAIAGIANSLGIHFSSKKFSKRTRLIAKIWKKAGMLGVAFLTPIVFTPIGGTLIALSLKVKFPQLISAMILMGIFWSIIINLFIFFGISPILRIINPLFI